MLSTTCEGVVVAAGRRGPEPGTESQRHGHGGASAGEERRQGLGVQEWPDGSKYEGEFVNGLKHGKGRYTWINGEYYEGSFYKDYKHGAGLYCWPTGHKFIGKFYLNRKEGYGQQVFPDGATFQGLYHTDHRFGPGVVSYPDGRQDVGLWLRECLLRFCTPTEEGFSLKNFPEYAAYMDSSVTADSLTQPHFHSSDLQTKPRTDSKVKAHRGLLADENAILPPGMETYSTDGDHLPLPPGRRRELDQHFFGELWQPDAHPYQGYERDPLSTLPLQARMQAHTHKHRLQAVNVGWDVAAILSMNRENFGPKGPLEVHSELLIQHASRGELQAVSQILRTGLVHPDVADSQKHTALIAATVNCHNDVIHLLLDMGADIDMLTCEGMSALAVCHVLYYPFKSLNTSLIDPSAKTPVVESQSSCANSLQISQVDFTADTTIHSNRPQTTETALRNPSQLSDQTSEKLSEHISSHSSEVSSDSELITERWLGLNETTAETEHLQDEERKDRDGRDKDCEETERGEESSTGEDEKEGSCDQTWEDGKREVKGMLEFRNGEAKEKDVELVESRETESRKEEQAKLKEDVEDAEKRGSGNVPDVERSIEVLDGHITLGSVKWKETGAKGKDTDLALKQSFDSACSLSSYNIQVTEGVMQRSAEALSRTGFPQCSDTQGTVRKMAAMKIEHRVRLNTLKLLLERGADPNAARVPLLVLFLAIMAADTEAVRRLLLCGARTDIPLPPEKKGLYPLHVAAALPGPEGPRITELLLHTVPDPDTRACDQDEIYEPDRICMKTEEPLSSSESPHLKEGGRTALHVACQRDSDYLNASKVVALLVSHSASTDLLWSGHSPLSLAIASGNELAVEELLKGGADPSIPLGCRVGSALCALANINYYLCGNRIQLLEMLATAGADILMPVTVGDAVGTAVDYAHYSFNQDLRIAKTPFHVLNMREREILKARRQLLSKMGDLLRRAAGQREREELLTLNTGTSRPGELPSREGLQEKAEDLRKPKFAFCYHCGLSVSVKLTACSRCNKVFYCSRTCKLKAWNQGHKEECIRVSAPGDGIKKRVVFKSPAVPRPPTVTSKSETVPRPLSAKLKSDRLPEPLSMAEKVLKDQANLNENYSFI
ncbi:ankyrin repeat and MYND domain-containing protein 1 isoform X1 [Acanthochromis polyacanthus]|uniref:ankyrin repeat and MYND domain-containing protein 1 isoform X1 n=1 Tax=Acanthochromis polyacanthus TaxID=80966 RepID=UPI002234314C|nr:ankyrin repeat and MYND domain-containing protein 1 isoform X1 [Acanthochromis polyacanthus]